MKAMNIQEDIPSFPIDNLKDHYVLVFDLTSMQDATENFEYRELVEKPLRLGLYIIFSLEHVTELILGERISSVAVDQFGVVEENILKKIIVLSSKNSIVSRLSGIAILVHFSQTMFRFFLKSRLKLKIRNPAIGK